MAESAIEAGIPSFSDAVKAARETIAAATADVPTDAAGEAPAAEGVVADQATLDDVLDHPASPADAAPTAITEKQETFMFEDVADELLTPNPLDESRVERDLLQEVVEDGRLDQPISVDELVNGYLRQSDYTKKTQALADERKAFEAESQAASKLMDALRSDPAGTIASLALEVGLVQESDLSADVISRINREHRVPSREEVERQVEERAKALLETDPRVQAAEDAQLMQQINDQFGDIEKSEGVKFSQRDKEAILQRAVEMETTRLDLAYLDLKSRAERLRSERRSAQQSAPQAPQAGRVEDSTSTQPTAPAKTVLEAWKRAKATTSS